MNDRPRIPVWKHVIGLIVTVCLVIAACGVFLERSFLEKLATQLLLPCGVIWLALLAMTYVGFLMDRRWGSVLLVLLLFYWVAGSAYTSDRILSLLETRYEKVEPQRVEPFDMLIVLGGGTLSNRDGAVWLSSRGDRVMLAARLYHAGKVKRLVSTGRHFTWYTKQELGPAAAAARCWTELGIPSEAILEIGGRNTSEEMRQIRELIADESSTRVGLLTSACHLPRATRLAQANGLNVVPVPADFRTGVLLPWPLSMVPTGEGFVSTELCVREYLAFLVGR